MREMKEKEGREREVWMRVTRDTCCHRGTVQNTHYHNITHDTAHTRHILSHGTTSRLSQQLVTREIGIHTKEDKTSSDYFRHRYYTLADDVRLYGASVHGGVCVCDRKCVCMCVRDTCQRHDSMCAGYSGFRYACACARACVSRPRLQVQREEPRATQQAQRTSRRT